MSADRTRLGARTVRTGRKQTFAKRFRDVRTVRTVRTGGLGTMLLRFSDLRTVSRVGVRYFVRHSVRRICIDNQHLTYLRPVRPLYIYQKYRGIYIYTTYIWDVLYRKMPVRAGCNVRA